MVSDRESCSLNTEGLNYFLLRSVYCHGRATQRLLEPRLNQISRQNHLQGQNNKNVLKMVAQVPLPLYPHNSKRAEDTR